MEKLESQSIKKWNHNPRHEARMGRSQLKNELYEIRSFSAPGEASDNVDHMWIVVSLSVSQGLLFQKTSKVVN
jgi:hypothetical protein